MKKLFVIFFTLLSFQLFAEDSPNQFTGDYEFISGDEGCPGGIFLSSFEENELLVNKSNKSGLWFSFGHINEGTTSATYGEYTSKVCYKNELSNGKLTAFQSDDISVLKPCFLAELEETHSIQKIEDTLEVIYGKSCIYRKI